MPRSKLFSEKLEEQINRLEKLEVGGREQRTLSSITNKLVELKDRLMFLEKNDGIKRVRTSKTDKESRVPSKYQLFVTEMSGKLIKKFPVFVERSKEIGRLWAIRKREMGSDSDNIITDSDEDMPVAPKKKTAKKPAAKKPKAAKKGGFYEEAYNFNYF